MHQSATILLIARDEMRLARKAVMLKTQFFGCYFPVTKLLTYVISITTVTMLGTFSLEQAVRVIGLMEYLTTKTSFEIPSGVQYLKEAVMSLQRIQVIDISPLKLLCFSMRSRFLKLKYCLLLMKFLINC